MSRKRVTSIDVAKAAGVSQSVVSRAFTPGAKVAAKTREHVLGVAKEMGYQPSALARGLVKQDSNLVAILSKSSSNPIQNQVLHQLTEGLQAIDKQSLLIQADNSSEVSQLLEAARQYQVQAVIVLSIDVSPKVVNEFAKIGIPLILFNRYLATSVNAQTNGLPQNASKYFTVACDNRHGGRIIAENFLRAGHERFAFIGGQPDSSSNQDRRQGFIEALGERNISLAYSLEQSYSYDWGREATNMIFSSANKPDALFCASDLIALGAMDALRLEHKLEIPSDVAVVGFDDIEAASWQSYNLTTVKQPLKAMVDQSIEFIDNRLNAVLEDSEIQLVKGEFVERKTTLPTMPTARGKAWS